MAHPGTSYKTHSEPHVLIADADPSVRSALRLVLVQVSGLRSVSEATDARTLLAHAAASPPDLVVMDWSLSGLPPDDVIAGLRACAPHAVVVVLSARPETRSLAVAVGADAFVCKSDDPARLLAAIQQYHWPLDQVRNPPSA